MKAVTGMYGRAEAELPWWHPVLMGRCRARLGRGEYHGHHYGRCDLRRGHAGVHVLERGMEVVRFRDDL